MNVTGVTVLVSDGDIIHALRTMNEIPDFLDHNWYIEEASGVDDGILFTFLPKGEP